MRRPTDNPAGYAATTLLTARARQLHVSSYLLVHGSADDNVHYQNSALLTEQLTRSQQHFQQFTYTNANHGMNGLLWLQSEQHAAPVPHDIRIPQHHGVWQGGRPGRRAGDR